MIQIDYSLILQIINFILLILILNYLLYKPLLGAIDKRKKAVDESEEEINRLNRVVEEKMAAYESKLQSSKINAMKKNKEIIKDGSEKAKTIIDEASKEISIMTEEFYKKMDKEVQAAKEFLTTQTQSLSYEIAEKVLGRRMQ